MALASAVLFGASTPLAKWLLGGGVDPWVLAGLLYLGSGIGLAIVNLLRGAFGVPAAEAPLRRGDLPWLSIVIVTGGIIGPLLLIVGLFSTPASTASLLLNVEGLATMAIAWLVFRENVDRRLLIGAAAILAGAVLLSWNGGPDSIGRGAWYILGACLAWGIDNNLTRKLSSADPVQIASLKGIVAGTVNLTIALGRGAALPALPTIFGAGIVGLFGYGVSLVLFVLALRHLGTARTGAYFSLAPFIGTMLALMLFNEPITIQLVGAAVLMGVGLYLHLAERHLHGHAHEAMAHEHRHSHDQHHRHSHAADDPAGEPHSHPHQHTPMIHSHQHYPDLHHWHDHSHAGNSTVDYSED